MTDTTDRTFSGDFKRFFVRGLVVLLPTVLTLWIVVKGYQFVDNAIAEPINRGIRISLANGARVWDPLREKFDPSEDAVQTEIRSIVATGAARPNEDAVRARLRRDNITAWWNEHYMMDLIGLFVAIIIVYIAGRLLGGYLGRTVYRKLEKLITSLPVFKQVYPYVKQIVDFLFSDEQPIKFNRVVAVEYPRKGIWSVGFMTGDTLATVAERAGKSATVFIPSSPTPFTGYTITVKLEDMIELPLSVEEAIRFAVSGGVLVPEHQRPGIKADRIHEETGLIPIPAEHHDDPEDESDQTEQIESHSQDRPGPNRRPKANESDHESAAGEREKDAATEAAAEPSPSGRTRTD